MQRKGHFSLRFRVPEFVLAGLVLLSGAALAFSSGSFLLNVRRAGFSVISAADKGIHFVVSGAAGAFTAVRELGQLRKDYDELVARLENYEQMQRSNADIRKENERLKEQLDFSMSLEEMNVPARIISRNLDDVFSYLTVDKGSVNGIRKNMPVIAIQNGSTGLVGKVVQVGSFTCQIMPVYNIDSIVSARLQNTRDLGLVNGLGTQDQPLILQYIRKRVADELSYGDIVVTSGENYNYMRDIPIGSISKITALDYNSSLRIELTPVIDFARLETVIVVNQKELNDMRGEDS